MQSTKSAVPVVLDIDADRADRLAALAAIRGVSVSELVEFFLTERLNHPEVK